MTIKKLRILNVGCGTEIYGTDFIDFYPSRKGVKRCDIDRNRFPYSDSTFDQVYSKMVFEHLTNPAHFLSECNRVLKTGGKIIIITDNAGMHGLIGRVHTGNYEVEHADHPYDRHYMLFTPHHMRNWLTKFGFEIKYVKYARYDNDFRISALVFLSDKLSPNLIAEGVKI